MFLRSNLPGIAWALLILFLTGMPGEKVPESSLLDLPFFDKWVHAFLFLVLAFLLGYGFKRQYPYPLLAGWNKTASFVIAIFYGFLTEFMQYTLFINRSMEASDMLANTTGAGLGIIAYRLIYGRELA